ncbi:MAG: hypothetical protein R3C41_05605 [Calditrichia bacterium]|nr:hypothetical protein [Calditrichota bacterium]MCB0266577.1 hypothetical protein [Calditrichota bacterium]MCB0287103.1 hypothetical protein [Calditrichota bacterium]MCB9069916.1 hypothetical protein [Calditrichia bacterium]
MKMLNRLLGRNRSDLIPAEPFAAKIIFECARVLDNRARVEAAVQEFMQKYLDAIAEPPVITQASDGNVIEITMLCDDQDDMLQFNRELEIIAFRYGLRE